MAEYGGLTMAPIASPTGHDWIPLHNRVDLDRLHALLILEGKKPNCAHDSLKILETSNYKINPWGHMNPYELQMKVLAFIPDADPTQPGISAGIAKILPATMATRNQKSSWVWITVGITDHWDTPGLEWSSCGAKLYVRCGTRPLLVRVALAWLAEMLEEDDIEIPDDPTRRLMYNGRPWGVPKIYDWIACRRVWIQNLELPAGWTGDETVWDWQTYMPQNERESLECRLQGVVCAEPERSSFSRFAQALLITISDSLVDDMELSAGEMAPATKVSELPRPNPGFEDNTNFPEVSGQLESESVGDETDIDVFQPDRIPEGDDQWHADYDREGSSPMDEDTAGEVEPDQEPVVEPSSCPPWHLGSSERMVKRRLMNTSEFAQDRERQMRANEIQRPQIPGQFWPDESIQPGVSAGSSSDAPPAPQLAAAVVEQARVTVVPDAIRELEKGNITVAEGMVYEKHMERGYKLEADFCQARNSYYEASAHLAAEQPPPPSPPSSTLPPPSSTLREPHRLVLTAIPRTGHWGEGTPAEQPDEEPQEEPKDAVAPWLSELFAKCVVEAEEPKDDVQEAEGAKGAEGGAKKKVSFAEGEAKGAEGGAKKKVSSAEAEGGAKIAEGGAEGAKGPEGGAEGANGAAAEDREPLLQQVVKWDIRCFDLTTPWDFGCSPKLLKFMNIWYEWDFRELIPALQVELFAPTQKEHRFIENVVGAAVQNWIRRDGGRGPAGPHCMEDVLSHVKQLRHQHRELNKRRGCVIDRLESVYLMRTEDERRKWFDAVEGYYVQPLRDPRQPKKDFGGPVEIFMLQHRNNFNGSGQQVNNRNEDRTKNGCATQTRRMQASRFTAYLVQHYGGPKAIRVFLEKGRLQDIMLPTIRPQRVRDGWDDGASRPVVRRPVVPWSARADDEAARPPPGHGWREVNNRPAPGVKSEEVTARYMDKVLRDMIEGNTHRRTSIMFHALRSVVQEQCQKRGVPLSYVRESDVDYWEERRFARDAQHLREAVNRRNWHFDERGKFKAKRTV